ncbi:LOW QUALITY PROTEIN: kinesin-like protein KIN-7L, partial [Pollicipes pollicipes]|uniref:LOW QUALITY PROTEIN: kinesin-like protein KIN-7L n=1 Tax=Pollicipes pollicipes TaxID=41117 RepID=UPI001884E0D7
MSRFACGKTHTMLATSRTRAPSPRVVHQMFDCVEQTPDREYLIRVSYMEIYKEVVADLLAEGAGTPKGLRIHEDPQGQVYVSELRELCVNTPEMLLGLMGRGETARHFGVTNMNDRSSRSHTIFRIIIESRVRDEEGEEGAVVVSHLNLVDLAGSERARQTGATGERFREGCSINSSLFELGNVISKLSEGAPFINYRNSKLTRILQTSLGGNAKTAIICTVTPAAVEETHSTLRFASRAKTIKNKPHINEVVSDSAHLKRLKREIHGLRAELQREKQTNRATEVEEMQQALAEQSK